MIDREIDTRKNIRKKVETGTGNPDLDESYEDYLGADQSVDSIYDQSFHGQGHIPFK